MSKFYITTPIYYVTAPPTVGSAYTTVAADVLARYHRARGDEVLFATGSDEHAEKVVAAARERAMEPKAFVDYMADLYRQAWVALNIRYDDFIQTTEPRHKRAVQALLEELYRRGQLYRGAYEGWYCVSDATFFPESELVEGRCPNPECGRPVTWVSEPACFFKFSEWGERLLQHIEQHPDFLGPDFRRNEVISFIQGGLKDACISRLCDWGTPLPASIPGSEGMVVYVWVDALINYVTVAGYPDDPERFAHWWPADLHLMAKDIFVRFHATLWPAMLMAAGLAPPRRVFAHGYWTYGGEKISKSRGHRADPVEIARNLAAESGVRFELAVDTLRYFLLRQMPFGLDGDFSVEALEGRYNADLANDLGNLASRSLTMIARYCGGRIPAQAPAPPELAETARAAADEFEAACERTLDFSAGLRSIWALVGALNRYIDQQAPWQLAREGHSGELNAVLYVCAESLRLVSALIAPVMPATAGAIRAQLGLADEQIPWSEARAWGILPAGNVIARPEPLFPRLTQQPAGTAVASQGRPAGRAKSEREEQKGMISIQDFQQLDLRIGTIRVAEPVPGADKLLTLTVDLGDKTQTMVAGIARSYRPEELVGKQVVVVANLQPAAIRGVRSEGMVLAASADGDDRSIVLLTPDRPIANGTVVR